MSIKKTIRCSVFGFRDAFKMQKIEFSSGTELNMMVAGAIGPKGITRTAADLIDVAAAVYQIELQLRGRQRTNPPERFEASIQLRDPSAWNSKVIGIVQDILWLLGNAKWSIKLKPGLHAEVPTNQPIDGNRVDQVVLFSGGMDSTCGLASIKKDSARTQLVSFYTRQKSLQREIASELGFSAPVQWRMSWKGEQGLNRSFYYRSFLFLCLAAAVAESLGTKTILQFENGVLASAIPPSPAWMMTKHAHPKLHNLSSELFSALFGGRWQIKNPFLLCTKRDCYNKAAKSIGRAKAKEIVQKTVTCWYHWSNRIRGGEKKPGLPCGVCIPCIVRRTGFQYDTYQWDLRKDSIRNDIMIGRSFRSYFGFLEQVAKTKSSLTEFYRLLPATGRSLISPEGAILLEDLHTLFLKFSGEFMETYQQ